MVKGVVSDVNYIDLQTWESCCCNYQFERYHNLFQGFKKGKGNISYKYFIK